MLRMRDRSFAIIGDKTVFWLAAILAIGGLFCTFDAGYANSIREGGSLVSTEVRKQFALLLLSAFIYLVIVRSSWTRLQAISKWLFAALFIMCILVFIPPLGHQERQAWRWLDFRVGYLQPGELMKPVMILFAASVLMRKPVQFGRVWRDWPEWMDARFVPFVRAIFPWVLIGTVVFLIERQPDMGTASCVAMCAYGVLIFGGVRARVLIGLAIVGLLMFYLLAHSKDYRAERMLRNADRWSQEGVATFGYQPAESEKAQAVGGLTGVGIGRGHAKHVLPAATTDYAFTTIAEEFGLMGSLIAIALIAGLSLRLIVLSTRAPNRWCRMVIGGVGWWIGSQAVINLLMVGALLPSVGIPLPFISYGGSSLLALAIGLGAAQTCVNRLSSLEDRGAADRNWRRYGRTRLTRT